MNLQNKYRKVKVKGEMKGANILLLFGQRVGIEKGHDVVGLKRVMHL